jgi:small subunit ribosomal protein S1
MENLEEKFDDGISMENVANSALDAVQPRRILQGEIVTIDNDFAYINVGTKSDGRVSLEEFKEKPRVGDIIDIMLINNRMVDGMYHFSRAAAEKEKSWRKFLETVKGGGQFVSGTTASKGAKGIVVDVSGVSAFVPFSHAADIKVKKVPSDEIYTFKIITIDDKKRTLLLSRKAYLDEEKDRVWGNLSDNYKPGDRIRGKVTKFVEFGAFVDIGGIEGLLHKNDMTWKRVFKKKNIIKVGDETEFLILDINRDKGKVSLGLKQLAEDPWLSAASRYHAGDAVNGRVVTITGQGVFVEIEDGMEGYIPASEVAWAKRAVNIKETFKKGQAVSAQVLAIDTADRKLTLGIRQLTENPWDTIVSRYPIGAVLKRPVKKVVSFGIFVGIEDEIDGLIHLSDISWDENVKDPASTFAVGDEIEFKIIDIKKDEMKISCGIKQLQKSPWEVIKEKYPPRMRVSGMISGVVPFGIFVKLEGDIEGLVHISEVSRRKIENLEEKFKTGDQVNAMVLGVDVERKRLSLSMKQLEAIVEKEELSKILNNSSPTRVTIGDIMRMKQGE